MNALLLTLFVSGVLATGAVSFFIFFVRGGASDHHDRLSLLPLLDDEVVRKTSTAEESSDELPHTQ